MWNKLMTKSEMKSFKGAVLVLLWLFFFITRAHTYSWNIVVLLCAGWLNWLKTETGLTPPSLQWVWVLATKEPLFSSISRIGFRSRPKDMKYPGLGKASQEFVWNGWFSADGCFLQVLDFWLEHIPTSSQPRAPRIQIGSGQSIVLLFVLSSVVFVHWQTGVSSLKSRGDCQQPKTSVQSWMEGFSSNSKASSYTCAPKYIVTQPPRLSS